MAKEDELVLVLQRDIVVPKPWSGIKSEGVDDFENLVRDHAEYKKRGDVEEDPSLKQLIPYMVFRFQDRYWLMQRTAKSGEERLHNLFTLGIGGHIRKEDLDGATIADWASREFQEEVDYKGIFKSKILGLLNDDSIPVNKVHIGCVMLLEGNTDNIAVRENHHQDGQLLTLEEVGQKYEVLESWSQIVYNFLKEQNG